MSPTPEAQKPQTLKDQAVSLFSLPGRYLWLGLALTIIASVLLSLRGNSNLWNSLAPAFLALFAFSYWSFYWHLHVSGVSDPSAMALAALPLVFGFVFIKRESVARLLSRVGKFRVGSLEVELDKAVAQVERQRLSPIVPDPTLFVPKGPISRLHEEAQRAVDDLMSQPPAKRILYVWLDLGAQPESYFDAAVLYIYLMVLRDAVEQVRGVLSGILMYKSHPKRIEMLGIVETCDYIKAFELEFPAIRKLVMPDQLRDEANAMLLEEAVGGLEKNTSLVLFRPKLDRYIRNVELVDKEDFGKISSMIPYLLSNKIEYLAVMRDQAIVSVIPIESVTNAVAKAVAATTGDYTSS